MGGQRARCAAMASTAIAPDHLRKGDKIRTVADLRDVPEGTTGKVIMVDGLTWIRYWVHFDNGVYQGSIPRSKLVTAKEWKRHLAGEPLPGQGGEVVADDSADVAADGAGDAGAGGKSTPSGTLVPQKLLDRAAAARVRLGG